MENESKKITFWGCELSEEELKYHRMSYRTLSSQFDCVLCNNIVEADPDLFDNVESGTVIYFEYEGDRLEEDEREKMIEELENLDELTEEQEQKLEELNNLEPQYEEIYQYYIVSDNALWYLKKANELVFYSILLDCYVWCICHYGTSWDYVLTNIKFSDDFSRIED